ncbi:protein SIN3 [Seminavis robusta]|uniref:Protein SIN3 n=1 Tax=Seminavis robusta TaxID=568900 RepID=A0A9N8DB40_9STRA|nr:protein SIN3 [Seminavis robusta]|eukprot:Sro40_g024840.1 protein SIN3 (214) ;mRNA; f:116112-116753
MSMANDGLTLKVLDAEFSCTICFERFASQQNALLTPHSGICGHSFCKRCILNLLDEQEAAPCPLCQNQAAFVAGHLIPNVALCKLYEAVVPFVTTDDDNNQRQDGRKKQSQSQSNNEQPPTKRWKYDDDDERSHCDFAQTYVAAVKSRFANTPEKYRSFLNILQVYQRGIVPPEQTLERIFYLLEDHSDLLDDFTYFLPDNNNQEEASSEGDS